MSGTRLAEARIHELEHQLKDAHRMIWMLAAQAGGKVTVTMATAARATRFSQTKQYVAAEGRGLVVEAIDG